MADQGISSLYQPTLAEMVKIEPLTEKEKLFTVHLKEGHDLVFNDAFDSFESSFFYL